MPLTQTAPPVVIVADDDTSRKVIAEALRFEGYRVSQAKHGAAAVARPAHPTVTTR